MGSTGRQMDSEWTWTDRHVGEHCVRVLYSSHLLGTQDRTDIARRVPTGSHTYRVTITYIHNNNNKKLFFYSANSRMADRCAVQDI